MAWPLAEIFMYHHMDGYINLRKSDNVLCLIKFVFVSSLYRFSSMTLVSFYVNYGISYQFCRLWGRKIKSFVLFFLETS